MIWTPWWKIRFVIFLYMSDFFQKFLTDCLIFQWEQFLETVEMCTILNFSEIDDLFCINRFTHLMTKLLNVKQIVNEFELNNSNDLPRSNLPFWIIFIFLDDEISQMIMTEIHWKQKKEKKKWAVCIHKHCINVG